MAENDNIGTINLYAGIQSPPNLKIEILCKIINSNGNLSFSEKTIFKLSIIVTKPLNSSDASQYMKPYFKKATEISYFA